MPHRDHFNLQETEENAYRETYNSSKKETFTGYKLTNLKNRISKIQNILKKLRLVNVVTLNVSILIKNII